MTRGVRLTMELDSHGLNKNHRYVVTLGDGGNSGQILLANTQDQYADPRWRMLLGDARHSAAWQTDTNQIYVTVHRQYPNPDFDFEPASYQHREWLAADIEITQFRLYNPWMGWPTLDWPKGNGWNGGHINYGQGEEHDFSYSIDEYLFKYNESDVHWKVRRNDDSDNYKEFVLRLSV